MVHLKDYRLAKEFVADCEDIFKVLEKHRLELRKYKKYAAVDMVMVAIEEASFALYENKKFYTKLIEDSKK